MSVLFPAPSSPENEMSIGQANPGVRAVPIRLANPQCRVQQMIPLMNPGSNLCIPLSLIGNRYSFWGDIGLSAGE